MKYIKTYENIIKEPQIGDYVIIDYEFPDKEWTQYITNSIGQIIITSNNRSSDLLIRFYVTKQVYDNFVKINGDKYNSFNIENNNIYINIRLLKNRIKYISKNKEELEIILAANKYNL
jgi:hypothetical protein